MLNKTTYGGLGYTKFDSRVRQEGSMPLYVVRFMKTLLGENGREVETCQGTLEVDAATEGQAVELAKQQFCEKQALRDWSLRADRFQVRGADFPV